jgi:predicted dehydrogenase
MRGKKRHAIALPFRLRTGNKNVMQSNLTRRSFIKRASLAAGALPFLSLPNLGSAAARNPGDKLNCVQVGCGGRSKTHLEQVIVRYGQNLVAIVDPDEKAHRRAFDYLKSQNIDTGNIQVFTDYRVMFDKMHKQLDAVFVAAPNHHHVNVSMMAMQRGLNVYCEKPLTHDVSEARRLREASHHYKVATQMGNQGHCEEGYRRLCEFIWAGMIGNVTETHSWTNRANGGVGPRPPSLPVPPGLHWDSWIGPAPYRDYHADLHPHEWHGWYDFGNGSLGNMGCHVLDGAFWSLKVGHPDSIEAEMIRGGSDERYPIGGRIRWDVPAREGMPPLKVYWYEGLNATTTDTKRGPNDTAVGKSRCLPPLLAELLKQYPDEELDNADSGTLYVGDKGIIHTQTYGKRMHIIPMDKMDQIQQPPVTLPRPKDIFADFIDACRAGKTDTAAPFEYGARLTEFVILGNLAEHAGVGQKVEWDGPNMKVTNIPELNQWIKRHPRKGWKV